MPLFVDSSSLRSSNSGISLTANSITGLSIDSAGYFVTQKRPMFCAENTNAGISTGTGWQVKVFNNSLFDLMGNYNTSNGRFTAPVTGIYFLAANVYTAKNGGSSYDEYSHPMFWINGSMTQRQSVGAGPYRIRGRNYYNGGYSYDNEFCDLFYLTAGDYVQVYIYHSHNHTWYGYHSSFRGFLVS